MKPASDSYAVITFGCRVNQADSLAIEAELLARGCAAVPPEQAGVVIVNSCSVTAAADQGTRQTVRRLARSNPDVRVIVTGCYATRCPDEVMNLPNVTRVVPNSEKDDLVTLLADTVPWLTTAQRYGDGTDSCGAAQVPGMGGRTAVTLRVQTGCDERCSYCIIPRTRGAGRSTPTAVVLERIRRAVNAGYKEIVLTGVHLGSFGRDLGDTSSLTGLVRALSAWEEDVLFRISSLEPMDCAPEIVELVATSARLAPHFHLPLQHASDEMLAAMRRPYTASQYHRLVHGIRARIPRASIGSDIIVGFPGETDAHFEEMRAFLTTLPLTHLHVFPYSDRPGTEASSMSGKVDGVTIRARGREIRLIGNEMSRRFRQAQVGSWARALTVDDGWSAVTPNYLKVTLDAQRPRNQWVQIRIDDGDPLAAHVQ